MAPDLNAVAGGERFDYSEPGSAGYHIDQNVTWNDPNNRKLRVLTIGGGVTGILMAYQIQKWTPNVEHVIYEKNDDIGGWLMSMNMFTIGENEVTLDNRHLARESISWRCL